MEELVLWVSGAWMETQAVLAQPDLLDLPELLDFQDPMAHLDPWAFLVLLV